jgi:hypothetical protein
MKTTKKEITKKYKDAKIVSCAYKGTDKYNITDIDWDDLREDDFGDFFIEHRTLRGGMSILYILIDGKFAKIVDYKVKEKLYTLKKECEKYYPISKHTNKAYPIGEWGVPLTMLDEVNNIEITNTSGHFDYSNNEYVFRFNTVNGNFNIDKLADHLVKYTNEFFKL